MGFMTTSIRFSTALLLLCVDFSGARQHDIPVGSKSDVVVGTMKGLVESYVNKYEKEEADYKEADEAMQNLIDNSADQEAKERAIDEKGRAKTEHEKTLKDLAGFVRTLDDTTKALRPGDDDWKDGFPDMKTKIETIYTAYPALLQEEGLSSTPRQKMNKALRAAL